MGGREKGTILKRPQKIKKKSVKIDWKCII
jgi:hypothetical protein